MPDKHTTNILCRELAKQLLDFAMGSEPVTIGEAEAGEIRAYHEEHMDDDDLGSPEYFERAPYAVRQEESYNVFIEKAEDEFPELATADLDDIIGGTWMNYWMGEGFPMQTEIMAIGGRLVTEMNKLNSK